MTTARIETAILEFQAAIAKSGAACRDVIDQLAKKVDRCFQAQKNNLWSRAAMQVGTHLAAAKWGDGISKLGEICIVAKCDGKGMDLQSTQQKLGTEHNQTAQLLQGIQSCQSAADSALQRLHQLSALAAG